MTEQKAKKKKPGIYKRILKWIGLGLLVLLLIAALIFHAPWKVTILLLIILAACTVLPKPYRKWFWLSVAAVVLVLIIWVFLPEDNEGWQPYTFDEELAALNAKYAVPDSENAATIYNALLEDYDPNTMHPDFLDPNLDNLILRKPWLSRDYPELAKWLQDHQDIITTLIEASKIEDCRFPIVANTVDMSKQIDRLSTIRQCAFLLIRAANNDVAEERIEQALEKQTAVLQMAEHQLQQSTVIEMLVGKAIEALALSQFKRFIVTGDAVEKHISVIEEAVVDIKHGWTHDWPKILDGEKLFTKNMYAMFYEVNPKGKTRLSRDPTAAMRAQFPPLTYWRRKLMKAKTIFGWFYMPSTPQKAAELVENEFAKYYQMADANYLWPYETPELTTLYNYNCLPWHFRDMVMPSESLYLNFHDIYLRTIAMRRGIRILVSLRRYKNEHGQWPETLDSIKNLVPEEILVDPINGGSFVYKLTEENFTLYSKGKNNIDENGQYNSIWDPNSFVHRIEEDDRLIWPPSSSKSKKEKANAEQQ